MYLQDVSLSPGKSKHLREFVNIYSVKTKFVLNAQKLISHILRALRQQQSNKKLYKKRKRCLEIRHNGKLDDPD